MNNTFNFDGDSSKLAKRVAVGAILVFLAALFTSFCPVYAAEYEGRKAVVDEQLQTLLEETLPNGVIAMQEASAKTAAASALCRGAQTELEVSLCKAGLNAVLGLQN